MAREFKLPDLGEGIHEAQVVNVMINEGDTVTADQMVMEVETDKASVELPVPYAGKITKLNVKAGDAVKVGDVLLEVDGGAGAPAEKKAAKPAAASGKKEIPAEERDEESAADEPEEEEAPAARQGTQGGQREPAQHRASAPASSVGRVPPAVARDGRPPMPAHVSGSDEERSEAPIAAAPAVRRYAREKGVDLHEVHGTGPGGRIVKEDVERFELAGPTGKGAPRAESRPEASPRGRTAEEPEVRRGQESPVRASQPAPSAGAEALPDFSQWGPVRREKVAQIRKTIARQMQRAWTLPRVTHGDEADVTDLEAFRKEHGSVMADQGVKLSITAFMIKAIAGTLRQFPAFNASYDDAAGEMIFKDYVHIGIAVDTPKGLMVPVLRDADRKGLMTISKEMREIADRARDFKLSIDDMRGGTFTVTNVGALGGTFATPMINYPEVAILGMGKLEEKPVVRGGQIVIRKMLPLFLSFDHRVIDGADAARFCRMVIGFLENPLNLLLAS
ncbi:MAG TPA: dihydrolipoamide acetyltransferase family protein [Phycisphaerae bacterium]|nr:dihydrolipoamide acetyltransferase family protein [Phycisphaerae bacterium]